MFPYLILCPSTLTLIGACIVFVTGLTKLLYLNRDDIWHIDLIPITLFLTITSIDWHRILVSLQIYLPLSIWIAVSMSALVHPIFRWVAPGTYRRLVEAREARMAEWAREMEEERKKRLQSDPEGGILGEPREATAFEVGVNDETPLTGSSFTRMQDGPYVGIPGYAERGY